MSRYIKGKPDFADCEKCSRTYGTLGCCSTVSNEWVYSCLEGMLEKAYADGIRDAIVEVYDAPSIDIVFCKECKHNYNTCINHGKMQPRCDFTDRVLTENDYCSRGEREDE